MCEKIFFFTHYHLRDYKQYITVKPYENVINIYLQYRKVKSLSKKQLYSCKILHFHKIYYTVIALYQLYIKFEVH